MTRSAGPLLVPVTALGGIGLLAGLALRRPELVVLAAPFVSFAAVGVRASPPDLQAWFELDRDAALEGDEIAALLTLRSRTGVERLEVGLVPPRGVEIVDRALPLAIHLAPGDERELPLTLRLTLWGAPRVGELRFRARDRLGLVRWEGVIHREQRLKIVPRPERLRALVPPTRTQSTIGTHVARIRGEGIEFADTRAFVSGDRLRAVNWRATARRGTLVVDERHPERNADVVLLLDSFQEARDPTSGTLDRAVRVVASLVDELATRRDRVGLVTFGGILRWVEPREGLGQRYRIVDALLETGIEPTYAWKDVDVIPARALPARALVVAVSPLLDQRFFGALVDLRARGYDLAVLEVSPTEYMSPSDDRLAQIAVRLWRLQRAETRARLERSGIAVATLSPESPLAGALDTLRSFRRQARVGMATVGAVR
jgi:uncharacterized protein (DUF58 family)